jgi:hypothetical protein
MTKKALLFAAVLAGCLGAACAQMSSPSSGYGAGDKAAGSAAQQPTTAAVCTASPCHHTITVSMDAASHTCKVVVKPDIMYVKGVKDALIDWELDAPGDFKIVSIKFKDEEDDWLREYRKRVATPSSHQFHNKHVNARKADVTDDNTIDGSWYYSVVVSDGHTSCKLDPPVINGA